MSERHDFQLLATKADVVAAPGGQRACTDRSFELPTGLYVATVGSYLAFLAVMAIGFQSRNMILPMVIFVGYIVMLFGVPTLWVRMKPDNASRAMSMEQFWARGIDTATGHNSARAAAAQVLTLPVLILFFGMAVVTIAALS